MRNEGRGPDGGLACSFASACLFTATVPSRTSRLHDDHHTDADTGQPDSQLTRQGRGRRGTDCEFWARLLHRQTLVCASSFLVRWPATSRRKPLPDTSPSPAAASPSPAEAQASLESSARLPSCPSRGPFLTDGVLPLSQVALPYPTILPEIGSDHGFCWNGQRSWHRGRKSRPPLAPPSPPPNSPCQHSHLYPHRHPHQSQVDYPGLTFPL